MVRAHDPVGVPFTLEQGMRAVSEQEVSLPRRFYTLCNDRQPEGVRESNSTFDQRRVLMLRLTVLNERSILTVSIGSLLK